ncbi:hypothetical protein Q7C_1951 [Methylophaga frappieri]|jgi:phosphoglycolate phosphatase-like HAD superfamily hydrolase|uniref:Uncharacterized protein n=1 Tax=Methylophaga frappieri (strain ATCC BAA-2434 / DSM 25690 / JAM7) TaxID=754477 RepID=I1YJJ9_METFJ|nr:hypothetical protein [Methylophaga frappieri]AFJ03092.1 hypothetical protein Q7C_1951 [Methylophaga frappieri]
MMNSDSLPLIALDFDGVICDSAVETALSGWQVAHQLWPELPATLSKPLLAAFRQVRPVMETGFESILILRALVDGVAVQTLINSFSNNMDRVMQQYQLSPSLLKNQFAEVRDDWIACDFSGWVEKNPLYPTIKQIMQQIPTSQLVIITTKQERFVSAILSANEITVPEDQIYGMDRQLSKASVLRMLQNHYTGQILFVEDRLPTLCNIITTPELEQIQLWLATWGYNTELDQQTALASPRIELLGLEAFSDWPRQYGLNA